MANKMTRVSLYASTLFVPPQTVSLVSFAVGEKQNPPSGERAGLPIWKLNLFWINVVYEKQSNWVAKNSSMARVQNDKLRVKYHTANTQIFL